MKKSTIIVEHMDWFQCGTPKMNFVPTVIRREFEILDDINHKRPIANDIQDMEIEKNDESE